MWSLYVPILSKVDLKINCVNLKSVRTFLRITCLADMGSHMWSLVVPVHVKCLPEVKLGQVEVNSNIAP